MSTTKENLLVAPCGLSCGHCLLYRAKDDQEVKERLVSGGFNPDSFPCPGCRAMEGKVACAKAKYDFPKVNGSCATYACAAEHGVEFCFECPEFPCVKLQPCIDKGSELPHNMKVFYLSFIEHQGLDKFLKIYPELGSRYYFGRMAIGKGPQLPAE